MRVIAGRLRGRNLQAPASRAIRPTSDRLRESIFDILVHGLGAPLEGARVIDVFAGTGALGIEALSRGADFAMFVDDGSEARALIRGNVEALGLGGVTRIFRADATRLGRAPAGQRFGLAFLDPPYGLDLATPALAALAKGLWLEEGAIAVIEESAAAAVAPPPGFETIERRVYGDTAIVFARFGSAIDAG